MKSLRMEGISEVVRRKSRDQIKEFKPRSGNPASRFVVTIEANAETGGLNDQELVDAILLMIALV